MDIHYLAMAKGNEEYIPIGAYGSLDAALDAVAAHGCNNWLIQRWVGGEMKKEWSK